MCNIEYKKSIIESTLASAKLYYDDRIKNIELSTTTETLAGQSGRGGGSGEVNNVDLALGENGKSSSSSLFNLKRRLSSSKKKKDKKNALQELKIKEDSEKETEIENAPEQNKQHVVHINGGDNEQHVDNDLELEDNVDENEFDLLLNTSMNANEIASHLVNKIDRKVQLLDHLWQELNRQSLNYNNTLINFFNNLQSLQKSFEIVNQKLNQNEQSIGKINISNQIESDKLAEELETVKNYQLKISSYQPFIDNMCNQYTNIIQELQHCGSCFIRNQVNSSDDLQNNNKLQQQKQSNITTKFDDLNLRWSNLQNQLQENYLHLYSLIESSGADIFLKLADSVQSPWQRAVSANNKIPYYIK